MKRILIAVAVLLVSGGSALAAKPEAAAKKVFTKFLADLTKDPASANQLLAGCQFMFLPQADGAKLAPHTLSLSDLGLTPDATLKPKKLWAGSNPAYGDQAVWVGGDVDATMKTGKKKTVSHLRVSALLDHGDKGWTILVAHWAVPMADKDALAAAAAGTLAQPVALTDQVVQDTVDQESQYALPELKGMDLAKLAELVSKQTPLLGSAARQTLTDGAKIAKWKATVEVLPGIVFGAAPQDDGNYWMAANVKITFHGKDGKDVAVTYRATFIGFIDIQGEGGTPVPYLAVAQFSNPA